MPVFGTESGEVEAEPATKRHEIEGGRAAGLCKGVTYSALDKTILVDLVSF